MTARENVKEEKRNNVTELVFIIDRSGSMSGLESDTVGGFNSMIERQKEAGCECLVTTVLFNHVTEKLHDRVPLESVKKLTSDDYVPSGTTALIDAVGETIDHVKTIHRYIRPEDLPEKTLFVITTDGLENASTRYRAQDVKKTVKSLTKEGWEFLFIGANIDSVETAGRIGVSPSCAVDYKADRAGTAVLYDTVAETVCAMCECGEVPKNWSKKIKEDKKRRDNG